jgi:hypothetical protein
MNGSASIVVVIGIGLMFLPVVHAWRARDTLAIAAAIGLSLASAIVLATSKSVIHEILAALIWMAAYLGAVFADYSHPQRKLQ